MASIPLLARSLVRLAVSYSSALYILNWATVDSSPNDVEVVVTNAYILAEGRPQFNECRQETCGGGLFGYIVGNVALYSCISDGMALTCVLFFFGDCFYVSPKLVFFSPDSVDVLRKTPCMAFILVGDCSYMFACSFTNMPFYDSAAGASACFAAFLRCFVAFWWGLIISKMGRCWFLISNIRLDQ